MATRGPLVRQAETVAVVAVAVLVVEANVTALAVMAIYWVVTEVAVAPVVVVVGVA